MGMCARRLDLSMLLTFFASLHDGFPINCSLVNTWVLLRIINRSLFIGNFALLMAMFHLLFSLDSDARINLFLGNFDKLD